MMSTAEHLRRAKTELLRRGWCRGVSLNDRGEVCVMGALACAVGESPTATNPYPRGAYGPARQVFMGAIGGACILTWNDESGRTPEEVLEAFEAAIALAEQDEARLPLVAPEPVTV